MTEAIWIALLGLLGVVATTVGSVMVARINTQLKRIGADAAEARHQTKNSHEENLRDALDRQHDETKKAIEHLDSRTARIGDEVSQGRREALADRERIDALTQRVDDGLREHSTFRQQLDRLLRRA